MSRRVGDLFVDSPAGRVAPSATPEIGLVQTGANTSRHDRHVGAK